MADNPKVQSKFDRSLGRGLKAPRISTPGGVAPIAHQSIGLRKVDGKLTAPKVEHIAPGNTYNRKMLSPGKTTLQTDSIKQMKNKADYP